MSFSALLIPSPINIRAQSIVKIKRVIERIGQLIFNATFRAERGAVRIWMIGHENRHELGSLQRMR